MASTVSVKIDYGKVSLIEKRFVKGMFQMGFDIANQAKRNAPYATGALRNSIRVREMPNNTLEVVAGGSYGGFTVPYALRREYENKKHPNRRYYMRKAGESVMSGDYMRKYFGDITR